MTYIVMTLDYKYWYVNAVKSSLMMVERETE